MFLCSYGTSDYSLNLGQSNSGYGKNYGSENSAAKSGSTTSNAGTHFTDRLLTTFHNHFSRNIATTNFMTSLHCLWSLSLAGLFQAGAATGAMHSGKLMSGLGREQRYW